jgi:hypothetical protein
VVEASRISAHAMTHAFTGRSVSLVIIKGLS